MSDLLTVEFVSMLTDKWRSGVKRPWRISHAEVCEMLQTTRFPSTGQVESGVFTPGSPMWKVWGAELSQMYDGKSQLL